MAVAAAIFTLSLNTAGAQEHTDKAVGPLGPDPSQRHPHPDVSPTRSNRRARGRLKIDVFPSGQLFGIREQLGAVTSRAVEMGPASSVSWHFRQSTRTTTSSPSPGCFNSYDQQRDFFTHDVKGKAVWDDIAIKSDTVLLMYNPVGPIMTFSTEVLNGIESMRGLKARALIGAGASDVGGAWREHCVAADARGVFRPCQTGLIDTINSPPGSIRAFSWWEYLTHGQKPYQYYADAYIMANATWFYDLPVDLQQLLLEVGRRDRQDLDGQDSGNRRGNSGPVPAARRRGAYADGAAVARVRQAYA